MQAHRDRIADALLLWLDRCEKRKELRYLGTTLAARARTWRQRAAISAWRSELAYLTALDAAAGALRRVGQRLELSRVLADWRQAVMLTEDERGRSARAQVSAAATPQSPGMP